MDHIKRVPPKSIILLVGLPGSGKSTFCRQVVLKSLSEDRPVIFVATEHAPSDIIRLLREEGVGETPSGLLYLVDGFHETVGLATREGIVSCNCRDLTSIDVAISKQQSKIHKESALLVFDSLTSPYLLNGVEIIKFLRLSLAKLAAEGNSVLLCIDEGCGRKEDIGAMMSIVNGIIKTSIEKGSSVLNVVKHPLVKPTTIRSPTADVTPAPPQMSLESLNKKMDWIVNRLNYLETFLAESQKYPEVISFLRSLRMGTAIYGEPLKTLDRLVSAKRVVETTSKQDEISRIIVNAIALRGRLNISQLTGEVRAQRGRASRTTVRRRAKSLLENRALIKEGSYYRLAEEVGKNTQ